jgi:hypothetical protein
MRLRELKERIDAGEMVVNKAYDGCGVWVFKDPHTKRVYISSSVEYNRHNGFNAICEFLASEEDIRDDQGDYSFTSEECGWEMAQPPTKEQDAEDTAMIAEFIRIRKQYGKEAARAYVAKMIVKRQLHEAERQLFTIQNKRARSSLIDFINFLSNRYKSMEVSA